jgi:hypothetical protein
VPPFSNAQSSITHSFFMNISILDNKLGFTLDHLTTIVTKASNNFLKIFHSRSPCFFCNIFQTSHFKQLETKLQPPLIYACREWLSTLHVDNGQSLCMLHIIFYLSLPKMFLPSSYPHKEKKEGGPISSHPSIGRSK